MNRRRRFKQADGAEGAGGPGMIYCISRHYFAVFYVDTGKIWVLVLRSVDGFAVEDDVAGAM